MFLTSTTTLPLLPAGGVAAAAEGATASAELPAGSGFQPLLAALTRQLGGTPAPAIVTDTKLPTLEQPAVVPTALGKALPPGGESLPLAPALPEAAADDGTPQEIALQGEVPPASSALPVEPGDLSLTLSPAAVVEPAAASPAAGGDNIDNLAPASEVASPDSTTTTPQAAVGPTISEMPATVPTPTMPVADTPATGAVKRLLPGVDKPHVTNGPKVAERGAAAAAAAAAPLTANAAAPAQLEDAASFDLDAAIEQLDGAAGDTPSTPVTTAASRESVSRQYQGMMPAQTQIDVPVGKPGWSNAVVDKLMWFSAQQISSAEIHLNPADLGPMSVRINTHQEQATVYFTSHHAAVRDALDQALPRLREMFDSQGIQLLDAGVGGQGNPRQQAMQGEAGGDRRQFAGGGEAGSVAAEEDASGPVSLRISTRLLDAYA